MLFHKKKKKKNLLRFSLEQPCQGNSNDIPQYSHSENSEKTVKSYKK